MKAYHNSAVLRNDGLDASTGKVDLNAGVGVQVTIRINSTQALASIFDLNEVAIANPLTTNNNGNYAFKAADNIYDIIISEGTANEEKIQKVEVIEAVTPRRIIPFDTLALAIAETDTQLMFDGAVLNIADRADSTWDVVLASSVTANTYNIVQCAGISTLALVLRLDGIVNILSWGVVNDRVTDTSTAMAHAMSSDVLSFRIPAGIYRTQLNNGVSNRTFYFEDGAIIDGVIHITGDGPAISAENTLRFVDNVRIVGVATTTIRFGTFYVRKLNVDKIRITEVSTSYLNQTTTGGSTGVHLYFGTKEMYVGDVIIDSGALNYNFSVDQGPVKGADELPENIHVSRLVINDTDVTGLVTAETSNLSFDEIVQKKQGGANVAWISSNDKNLKVGKITHNGLGATSGQTGIYLNNTDADSSAEFGTIDVSNVPGIAFRTYNTGKVKIGTLIAKNNREHARIQSHVTIGNVDGVDSLEIGVNFHDNFAAGSSVGRCELSGTAGTGLNIGSDDITIPYAKCDGFDTLYGLHIPLDTGNFTNHYYEGANCSQALRILSADEINMGVINLHDNTSGIIGSGLGKFGFDYVYYNNNVTDSNFTLELSTGFQGKKIRQSTSVDRGDNSVSLEVGIDASTQRFDTDLTAGRTVTLTTANAQNGDKFRISRNGGGAFNLGISGTLNGKTLTQAGFRDYEFQGSGWHLTSAGDF